MKTGKKILIGVLVTALAAGGTAGASVYFRKNNQDTVSVVSVESLASPYYMDDTMLDGNVVTNVSQNIVVDKDMIIQEIYAQKGDSVKKGDKLISFDMTLVQMELNIAKLKKQQQEQNLNKAVNRLKSLQNGGPIEEEDSVLPDVDTGSDEESDMDEMAFLNGSIHGNYLAAASLKPILVMLASEEQETESAGDTVFSSGDFTSGENPDNPGEGQDNSQGAEIPGENPEGTGDIEFGDGSSVTPTPSVEPTPQPELSVTPEPEFSDEVTDEEIEAIDPEPNPDESDITDGTPVFYQKLDGDTEPFKGTGTKKDPFVFLCSSAKGSVIATGAFLNKMAGYQPDGTKKDGVNGYWYRLEFHQNDTITNFLDRNESCTGYYLVDGSLLEAMVDETAEMEYTLEGASRDEEYPEIPGGEDGGADGEAPIISREEAIKNQKNKIESLKLDIRESEIEISKLEKKVKKEVIYSKLDGVIANVGDPLTGVSDGDSFMTVKSEDGYYVKGTVSELLLDQVKEGAILNCSSTSGSFDAEVIDVSDYPVSSNSYMGSGNPNSSYYTYSASITDSSLQVTEEDWINVTLKNDMTNSKVIVLDKAFVKSENGSYYVFKDDNGVLKKQKVSTGGNVNGGYSILIKGGITYDDRIAFPYGKTVKEGAKTKVSTLEALYEE